MEWENIPPSIEEYIGFIYIITNKIDGRKYIGKKLFFKTVKLKPLKGTKRKRKVRVETDWKTYWGSSNELLSDIERFGEENFTRRIISCHKTRWEWSYAELKLQVINDVLLKKEYYNGIIRVRLPGYKK